VKRKTRISFVVIAIVILLVTTYEVFSTYFIAPPSYMSSGELIVSGPITIPPDAKVSVSPPEPTDAVIALRITAVYIPGVALLLFALFFKRKRVEARTTI
jgi:hypothetical protein